MVKSNSVANRDFDGNVVETTLDVSTLSYAELIASVDSGHVAHISDIEDTQVVEKDSLVNIPIIIVAWKRKETSDYGSPYVIVEGIKSDDSRFVFADGSTGIRDQLEKYETKLGGVKPFLVPKGLVRSDYTYEDSDGKTIPAKTFYFNTQA